MKIIFAGTPEFALPTLRALLHSQHKICAVYTQLDRPAGRGQKLTASPVKEWALANNLPLYQPASLKDPIAQKQMQKLNADILVNVAYGLLLPEAVLNIPKFGCINIHPSLLPRFRGAAPIQRAIMAGDTITGVTIMKMDVGLDTGDIYKQITLPIDDTDTTATLIKKTSEIGVKLLLEVLAEIETGSDKATPQNNEQTVYANKISKEEGKIDWHKSAEEIDRMIRAFNPWPIAWTYLRELKNKRTKELLNIPKYTLRTGKDENIKIKIYDSILENGKLKIMEIQVEGGKKISWGDFLNGYFEKKAEN